MQDNPTDMMRIGDVILKWLHGKRKPTWKILIEAIHKVDSSHAQHVMKKLQGLCMTNSVAIGGALFVC